MYQQIMIVGRLGRDAELRYTPTGVPVCNFTVAVNERWNGQDGQPHERTTWFRVTAWRKLAESCSQYLHKGGLVMVAGPVAASTYTGNDGTLRTSLEVTANTLRMLGSPRQAEAEPGEDGDAEEEAGF
jgi:single-strand DNA-binding protein